jgi:hypothetical protein
VGLTPSLTLRGANYILFYLHLIKRPITNEKQILQNLLQKYNAENLHFLVEILSKLQHNLKIYAVYSVRGYK